MTNLPDTNTKTFWQRPEGKVGLGVTLLAALLAAWGLYLALPALLAFVSNVLELAALCSLLGILFYLVADGRVRAFVGYLYKSFFRLLTGFFIEIDPIGILRSHIDELGQKLGDMRGQLGNLSGQIRRVEQ
jgi:hypothetical protein